MNYANHEERRYIAAYNRRREYLKGIIFRKMYFASKYYKITTYARIFYICMAILLVLLNDVFISQEPLKSISISESRAYIKRGSFLLSYVYHIETNRGQYTFKSNELLKIKSKTVEIHRDILYMPVYLQYDDQKLASESWTTKMFFVFLAFVSAMLFLFQKSMQLMVLKLNTQVLLFLQSYFFILYVFQIDFIGYRHIHFLVFFIAIIIAMLTKIKNNRLVWVSYFGETLNARD